MKNVAMVEWLDPSNDFTSTISIGVLIKEKGYVILVNNFWSREGDSDSDKTVIPKKLIVEITNLSQKMVLVQGGKK